MYIIRYMELDFFPTKQSILIKLFTIVGIATLLGVGLDLFGY